VLEDLSGEEGEEPGSVRIIEEHGLPRIPANGDVVQRAGKLQAERTGHGVDGSGLVDSARQCG
jgi:hypothetical protein